MIINTEAVNRFASRTHAVIGDAPQSGGEMHNVTMIDMVDAMTRYLDRDIHDPKTEHYSLSLLQKSLIVAKEHIDETFMPGAVEIPAPIDLQSSSLACLVSATVGIEAVSFGYTLENVKQANTWLVAWLTAVHLDMNI